MSAQPVTRVSPEEYLKADRASEFRSEYYDGCMYAMSGATFVHNLITSNVNRELSAAFRRRQCYVVSTDGRVRVSQRAYTFPDVVAICGDPVFADDQRDTLINPTLIVEVLSPSTEAYDRGQKFALYRQIESLREYVLVSQSEARVERFEREGDRWVLLEHVGLDATCRFASVDCDVALADIYEKVALSSDAAPAG